MKNEIKILIADEDRAGRRALAGELKRVGFETIIEAENGEEALILIERHRPDVAIIDVWLSKLDGIGVVSQAKSLKLGKDKLPAMIIVSAVSKQSSLGWKRQGPSSCESLISSTTADSRLAAAVASATPSTERSSANTKNILSKTFTRPAIESTIRGVLVSPLARKIAIK